MPNRLTRTQAAEFIGCGMSKFYYLIKSGQLDGTYYSIGNRKYFITSKLQDWMDSGGEGKSTKKELDDNT